MTTTPADTGLTFIELFDNKPSTPEQRAEVRCILHGPEREPWGIDVEGAATDG